MLFSSCISGSKRASIVRSLSNIRGSDERHAFSISSRTSGVSFVNRISPPRELALYVGDPDETSQSIHDVLATEKFLTRVLILKHKLIYKSDDI